MSMTRQYESMRWSSSCPQTEGACSLDLQAKKVLAHGSYFRAWGWLSDAMILVHYCFLRHHMNTGSGSIVETSCSDLRNCSSTFDVVSFLKMNVLYNDTDKLWDYFQKIM